jgi:transcriptional regulator with XRE-family HTH domain
MKKTNFDNYLAEQLKDEAFAERFRQAGEAWDVALQLAALRTEAGLSQKQLAEKVGTTQQQICRLESPSYEGHSLSLLRRVAEALNAQVRVILEPVQSRKPSVVAEARAKYRSR